MARTSLRAPAKALLSNSFSLLDGDGKAEVGFTLPPGSTVAMIGATFDFAYVVLEPLALPGPGNVLQAQKVAISLVSNAVSLTFVP